jgi:hypothetical protein
LQSQITLSPVDRTVLEASLRRMIGDGVGAVATLPLYCLGELPTADPEAIVESHFDIWHSCLVVVREVLRADHGEIPEIIDQLFATVVDLRDAYLALARQGRKATAVTAEQLVDSYKTLPILCRTLVQEFNLNDSFVPASDSLKQVSLSRTLQWVHDELQHHDNSSSRTSYG